jgi:hypothetical protein
MEGLVGTFRPPDLRPVAAEAGAVEGEPRPLYTWEVPRDSSIGLVRSYTPSDGGAPRLVVRLRWGFLGVWDTRAGAFLGALTLPHTHQTFRSLVTYQRPSDGRARVAAGSDGGSFCIFDGDDLRLVREIQTVAGDCHVHSLLAYHEPTTGTTRIVSG